MLQANIEISRKIYLNNDRLKILILYLFLIAGGLWHMLNVFQALMQLLAGPFVIGLSLWITAECLVAVFRRKGAAALHHPNIPPVYMLSRKFLLWSLLLALVSFGIEWVGVKTGVIFGNYIYGETLQPQLFNVPIAIGFAWLCMLLCTIAVLQRVFPRFANTNMILTSSTIAIGMVLFDFIMEPAAIALGYWKWAGDWVPYQNYIGWFVISFVLSSFGLKMKLFQEKLPSIAVHGFFAQLIYFLMAG